jgi:DNA (cytosine-5)-methyltransferase 1
MKPLAILNVLDLFSGIGGFSLGLERTNGFRTVAFCEIDPYCRKVLAKHWPGVPCYDDIRTLTAERLAANAATGDVQIDVICGGFPCQDISTAGAGAGIDGERSGLWSEYARIIGEIRPRFVIVENVAALLGRGLDRVLGDLAALGYDAEWHCIPASAVGAPHRRDRIWVVAYPNCGGLCSAGIRQEQSGGTKAIGSSEDLAHASRFQPGWIEQRAKRERAWESREPSYDADANRSGLSQWHVGKCSTEETIRIFQGGELERAYATIGREQWFVEPDVGRVANGIPSRVDRLRSLGNAVVPQIPEIIGNAILTANNP